MAKSVFVSYARATSREPARAFRAAYGVGECFLDEEDLELRSDFPRELTNALLDARVFVAFVDDAYLQRWYCIREWRLARAAFDERLRTRAPGAEIDHELDHVVIALAAEVAESTLRRLPPVLQTKNWPRTSEPDRIVAAVRERIDSNLSSIGSRLRAAGIPKIREDELVAEAAVPPPRNLGGIRLFPKQLTQSKRERFIGRANELWSLHATLTERSRGREAIAGVTGAIQGGGGFGKSQLALEYLHRFGPVEFPGGLFWIDASPTLPLDAQLYGVLRELRPTIAPLSEMQRERRIVSEELADALHAEAKGQPILMIVDNVPERDASGSVPSLATWCPALGRVTCIATSRKRLDVAGEVISVPIDVVGRHAAVRILTFGVPDHPKLTQDEWESIAGWVGDLPLALVLLNAALRATAIRSEDLLKRSRVGGASMFLDAQVNVLRSLVPDHALRGIAETFALSYEMLGGAARNLARRIAWLAPTALPDRLLDCLCDEGESPVARVQLIDRSFLNPARGSDSHEAVWSMHSVLADYLRANTDGALTDCERALSALHATLGALDVEDAGDREIRFALVPHLVSLCTSFAVLTAAGERDRTRIATRFSEIALAIAHTPHHFRERSTLDGLVQVHRASVNMLNDPSSSSERAIAKLRLAIALISTVPAEAPTDALKEALAIHREVLSTNTLQTDPSVWLAAQNSLGITLKQIGERADSDAAPLEEAIVVYRSSLRFLTRYGAPRGWALVQHNLAGALGALGARNSDRALLKEAVSTYRAALEVRTRDTDWREWALTMTNMGGTLDELAGHEKSAKRLKLAIAAHEEALKECARDRDPQLWASIQMNLGAATLQLGARERNASRIESAISILESVLEMVGTEKSSVLTRMSVQNLECARQALDRCRNARA